MSIKLNVNRRPHTVDAEADTPVLWVLRDLLGLTGTKYGCGQGLCGACTIHLDGAPVRSCSITIGDVAGRAITTIEGLSPRGDHAVQKAWTAESVPQCGYCQAGMLMTAAALLRRSPQPSDEEIADALSGHLCRCGTYPRIARAIHRAAGRTGETER